ncbi:DUF2742 domain-containing protein [Tsukamurella spumae]|uniref:DUF2742 domain-containing protein n=1 Tax=Tsukamurella spumae TaxID=44753 RepID=A0A846WZR2_9ACTN|nr:DUF2742 domain-containing protein [Tsukamurella spumae]NKY17522.1 DUF2742 domain-containing protein [Tsukamurella spumae]
MTDKISVESIRAWAAERNLLPAPGSARTGSREVSFSLALDYVAPFITSCPAAPPPAFSPQWLAEPDEQVRFVSVLSAALLWALHTEVRQDAMHDASAAIAEGVAATRSTSTSSARFVADDGAQVPFHYPPEKGAAA